MVRARAIGLGLDLVCGSLVAMHTYLYYFPLSLSLSRKNYMTATDQPYGM